MPRVHLDDFGDGDDPFLVDDARQRRRRLSRRRRPVDHGEPPPFRPHQRANERDSFKCGRCRAFVGPTVSGGRHRNHCPFCLTSRHVDARRPGDRASPCRALMAPVGTCFRPNGEQMVVHRCNGCGIVRQNRVAADDNPLAALRLPLAPLRPRARSQETEEAIA